MQPTLRQFEVFLAVAKAASFRVAAEAMHLSQPALSQHVAEMERELGARLFLVGGEAGTIEALGAGLRRDQRGQIDELPCLQGDQLIAGLAGLKDAGGGLAR